MSSTNKPKGSSLKDRAKRTNAYITSSKYFRLAQFTSFRTKSAARLLSVEETSFNAQALHLFSRLTEWSSGYAVVDGAQTFFRNAMAPMFPLRFTKYGFSLSDWLYNSLLFLRAQTWIKRRLEQSI